MALVSTSDLSSVILSVTQTDAIRTQINRQCVALNLLNTRIVGDPIAWDVEFTGSRAAAVSADTAAAPTATKDTKDRAVLNIGEYVTTAGVTGRAASAAAAALNPLGVGAPLLTTEVMKGVKQAAKQIAGDIYAGSGSNSIIGMATAIDSTGTYANLAQGTYSEWASTEQTGTLAGLTFETIDTLLTTIYTTAGERPNLMLTTPTVMAKVRSLFGNYQAYAYADEIDIAGTKRKLVAGATATKVNGVWMVEDPDCTSGTIYALNTDEIAIGYMVQDKVIAALQDPAVFALAMNEMIKAAGGGDTVRAEEAAQMISAAMNGGIMPYLKRLGPTGNQENVEVIVYPQLLVYGRKFHGKLTLS